MRDRAGWGRGTLPPGCPPIPAAHSVPLPPAAVIGPGGRLSPPQGPCPVTLISPCAHAGAAQLKLISRLTSCCAGNFRRVEVTCTHLCCSPSTTCVLGRCGGGCPGSAGRLPRDLSARSQALRSKGRGQGHPSGTKWALRGGTCQESSPGNSAPSRSAPCHSLNGSGVGAQGWFLLLCALPWPSHCLYALLWGYNPGTGLVPLIFPGPGSLLVPGVLAIPRLS